METPNTIANCILVAHFLLVFVNLLINRLSKTKKIQEENQLLRDEAKNYIKHHRDLQIRLSKIDKYLEENYNLSFYKIENLIKQENYKKNNVIDITNYIKYRK